MKNHVFVTEESYISALDAVREKRNSDKKMTFDKVAGAVKSIKSTFDRVSKIIDFTVYSENPVTDYGITMSIGTEPFAASTNGYLTFKAATNDPYVCLDGMNTAQPLSDKTSDKLRYIVVKYRTSTAGKGEFYTSRSDGVEWTSPYGSHVSWDWEADGEWHTILVDARYVWGNVEGVKLHAFRFDFLDRENVAGGSIDVSYIAFFENKPDAELLVESEKYVSSVVYGDPVYWQYVYNAYERYYTGTDNVSVTDHPNRIIAGYPIAPQTSADGIYRYFGTNPEPLCTELAAQYLAQNNRNLVDKYGDGWLFRGWVNPASTGFEIIAFGYLVDENGYYESETFVEKDDKLISDIGSASARRFNITIDNAHIYADGIHQVRLVVVLSDNNIYELSSFGTFWIQKNANYVDGDLNVYRTSGAKITKNGKTIDAIIAGNYGNGQPFLSYNPQIEVFQAQKGSNDKFVYPDTYDIRTAPPSVTLV